VRQRRRPTAAVRRAGAVRTRVPASLRASSLQLGLLRRPITLTSLPRPDRSDRFKTINEVTKELRKSGLEDCNLIVAIDATKSNEFQGERTFGGRCLHEIDVGAAARPRSNREAEAMAEDPAAAGRLNPYERVLGAIGRTLGEFDDDGIIPAFVFGDVTTCDRSVRTLRADGRPCDGLDGVLDAYREAAPTWRLSGPTSFAPAIDKAVELVKESGGHFHVLLIVADGQVTNEAATIKAVQRASHHPLAIVVCGVGDGPWDQLRDLDDRVPGRKFDNLQAVFFHEIEERATAVDPSFALAALMEVPDQFRACRKLGLLGKAA